MLDLVTDFITQSVLFLATMVAIIMLVLFPYFNKALQLIAIYFVISISVDHFSKVAGFLWQNNLFLYHYFSLFEFFILSLFFQLVYRQFGKKIKLYYFFIPVFILAVLNSIFIQSIWTVNSYAATVTASIIILYCLYYFYLSIENYSNTVEAKAFKWLIISIFVYQCATIMVLLFSNIIINTGSTVLAVSWGIKNLVVAITKAILIFHFGRFALSSFLKPVHGNQ